MLGRYGRSRRKKDGMNRLKKAVVGGAATALLAGVAMVGTATAADASPARGPFSCALLQAQADQYYANSLYYHSQGVYYGNLGNTFMAGLMFSYERASNINWINVQVC
jgi:hypothetical protein